MHITQGKNPWLTFYQIFENYFFRIFCCIDSVIKMRMFKSQQIHSTLSDLFLFFAERLHPKYADYATFTANIFYLQLQINPV